MATFVAPLSLNSRLLSSAPFIPHPTRPNDDNAGCIHLPRPQRIVTCSSLTLPSPSSSSSSPNPARSLPKPIQNALAALQAIEQLTRPGLYSAPARYEALPEHVKTDSQMLGRLSPGCEGTNSVFPRCNFSCRPCYHSADANKVRIDGFHTVTEVARQMAVLQRHRGSTGHCQLIGGEVSLLPAEDHALTLETMRFYGRIPMSFTHGDFDYDYLRRLALQSSPDRRGRERPRFQRLDFAVHFDIGMRGRKGTSPATLKSETDLHPHRRRFIDMFRRLHRDHGVDFYLAHNMTVQPSNLSSVAAAAPGLVAMGFRLISFQPAAMQGARRVDGVARADDGDAVWGELEKGLGLRLPYNAFQMGDVRCNRMTALGVTGFKDHFPFASSHAPLTEDDIHLFPLFDDQCPHDLHARDLVMRHVGNIVLMPHLLAFKLLRVFFRRPWLLFFAVAWCARVVRRAGGLWAIMSRGVRPVTVVMHRFMDAEDVKSAWALMQDGVDPDDEAVKDAGGERVRETMQRLAACSYGMAHPDSDLVVPACVQHSVYDPDTNASLAQTLPLSEPARAALEADLNNIAH